MRFSLLSLTTTLLAATTAHGAVTLSPRTSPNQVTTVLDQLTSGVGDLNAIAENINGLTAIILAPAVAQGLVNLNNAVSVASLGLNLAGGALPTPSVADQTAICTALGTFLDAFTALIATITLQAATLRADNVGAILEPGLELVLTTVQSFVTGTVTVVPVCGAAYTLELATVQTAVTALLTALG